MGCGCSSGACDGSIGISRGSDALAVVIMKALWEVVGEVVVMAVWKSMLPPLSMPMTPDSCKQVHLWHVQGFPWEYHPNGGNYDVVR